MAGGKGKKTNEVPTPSENSEKRARQTSIARTKNQEQEANERKQSSRKEGDEEPSGVVHMEIDVVASREEGGTSPRHVDGAYHDHSDHEEGEGGPIEEENIQYGLPIEPTLLTDFKDHVVHDIWNGKERGTLRCHHHWGRYNSTWKFEMLPDRAKEIVKKSSLINLILYGPRFVEHNLISAFVERWYPETNTFHLPFGEMTITLDDVKHILGFPCKGKSVVGSGKKVNDKQCAEWLNELLGLPLDACTIHINICRGNMVELTWLYEQCHKCDEEASDLAKDRCARAFLLHLLGSTIFSDKSGTRVSVYFIECLRDLDNLNEYNWCAATLAFMYRQLGMASRAECKQIAGYLPLVETWIHDHFWMGGKPSLIFEVGNPTLSRWVSQSSSSENKTGLGPGHLTFREHIDDLAAQEVIWEPYPRAAYPLQAITWFMGQLICFDYVEAYHASRVQRQMGRVQKIPKTPTIPRITIRKRNLKTYKVQYNFVEGQLLEWQNHLTHFTNQGDLVNLPWDCSVDYLDWFLSVSHPYVQKPSKRLTGPLRNTGLTIQIMRERCEAAFEKLGESWKTEDQTLEDYKKREEALYEIVASALGRNLCRIGQSSEKTPLLIEN